MLIGKIIKLLSGVYTVETPEGEFLCRAKGSFRNQGISPVAGDMVEILAMPDQTGRIEKILPRKNYLIRPNVSNVDALCYVVSYFKPTPFPMTIDKILIIAQKLHIEPYIIFNKNDMPDEDISSLADLYSDLGYSVFRVSAKTGSGMKALHQALKNKTVIFAGNSGVGKSSILNALYPELELKTGEISDKLGRGRHTTRHIELFHANGGFIGDTPGFGALELEGYEIKSADLKEYFLEFSSYTDQCGYINCMHLDEKECGVRNAAKVGDISSIRYENYRQIYQTLKEDETPWNKKNKN